MSASERKDRYIQFPLCLLMETYRNPRDGFNLILNFGIVNYAKSFKVDISEVGRQLMYCFYREQTIIPKQLLETIQGYIKKEQLSIDEDYCGFDGNNGSFDPLDFSSELLGLFESDHAFKESVIMLYQIRQAISTDTLSLTLGSIDHTLKDYEKGVALRQTFELKFGADVMPGIKIEHLLEYRNSEQNLDTFRAYIGIKSIIGRNTFATANKPVILSRMVGCKSKEAFEYYTGKDKNLLPTVDRYSKKYPMDKLLLTLAEKKFIMFLSKPKVSILYLSGFMEPEELRELVKSKKEHQNLKNRIRGASLNL